MQHYVRRAPSDQLVFTDRVKGTVQAGSSATDLQQQLVAYHIDPAVYHAARQVAMEAHTVLAKMVLRHHASPQPGAVKDRLQAAVLEAIPLEEARAWLQVARVGMFPSVAQIVPIVCYNCYVTRVAQELLPLLHISA
jgi:hypothetical protein